MGRSVDKFDEAVKILRGETMMLPTLDHLEALMVRVCQSEPVGMPMQEPDELGLSICERCGYLTARRNMVNYSCRECYQKLVPGVIGGGASVKEIG